MNHIKNTKLYLTLLVLLVVSVYLPAQQHHSFALNVVNGLPDDHIYGAMTDKHGYLWFTTPKGVCRFNGYELKLFNANSGLPNEDIYELVEDKKGRIWLGNISDEYGYLHYNRYYKAQVNKRCNSIYPLYPKPSMDGIIFLSFKIGDDYKLNLCYAPGDSIHYYPVDFQTLGKKAQVLGINNVGDVAQQLCLVTPSGHYIAIIGDWLFTPKLLNKQIQLSDPVRLEDSLFAKYPPLVRFSFCIGDYIIAFDNLHKTSDVYALNYKTGRVEVLNMKKYGVDEPIQYIDHKTKTQTVHVITSNNIIVLQCTNNISFVETLKIADLTPGLHLYGNQVSSLYDDRFWPLCIGTINNGMIFHTNMVNHFKVQKASGLDKYRYLGSLGDTVSYWWSSVENKLARVSANYPTSYYSFGDIVLNGVNCLVPVSADSTLFIGKRSYCFNSKTGNIAEIKMPRDIFCAIYSGGGNYLVCTNDRIVELNWANERPDGRIVSHYRYRGLVYDSLRASVVAYNHKSLLFHGAKGDTIINEQQLRQIGIKKVEQVAIDNTYGNIFVKGTDNVVIYNPETGASKELFDNLNTEGASIYVYRGNLVMVGGFGVLFSKIEGKNRLSLPNIYTNLKNSLYRKVKNSYFLGNSFIIGTDNGTYCMDIPHDSSYTNIAQPFVGAQSKYILMYADTVFDFKSGDTININQENMQLAFDVINPFGTGKLKFTCQYTGDSVFTWLNSNELTLPNSYYPGNYYKLSIRGSDDVWRGDAADLYVYITPFWYQTTAGRTKLYLLLALLAFVIIGAAVLITRKTVLYFVRKRNLHRELELKSIYAQLNPHFIFNTLNSALLLVSLNKMEDAYTHILRFSRLLRAYIKSSRNQLISIAHELINLQDYIDLQQTRFKNKFEYHISVSAGIDAETIMIPSLLLQPFVENAINHGILPMASMGKLSIEFVQGEAPGSIVCTIADNGIGRKQAKLQRAVGANKEESYGDLMIKDLVAVFNKYDQMNIAIQVTDLEEPTTGTIVSITIRKRK